MIANPKCSCYNTECVRCRATFHIGMSPSGKAPDFDSGIRRFKSGHPSQNDPLAQSVEHRPFKAGVLGSSPRRVTKKWRYPMGISIFYCVGGTRKAGPGNAGVINCPVDSLLGRGRVHWFQSTVEDCGLKPIRFSHESDKTRKPGPPRFLSLAFPSII